MNDYYEKQIIASRQNLDDRDFWLKTLSGDLQKSYFPYDFSETGQKEMEYDTVALKIEGELESKLLSASKGSDQALHMLLVSGLALLLAKYSFSSNNDILIGSFIYKQEIVGDFINMILPLRIRINGNMTFRDLLMGVKQTVIEAVKHQNYPVIIFSWELDMESRTTLQEDFDFPLFDTFLYVESVHDHQYTKRLLLNTIFGFSRTGERITGTLKYNTRRFERTTVERIARHFSTLLETVLFNPGLKLLDVDILAAQEKKQMLDRLNRPAAPGESPGGKNLVDEFGHRVRQTPDRIALIGPGPVRTGSGNTVEKTAVTYHRLYRDAARLAHLLRDKGISRDHPVALCVERSTLMVSAILAILEAGGAYLPLEPGTPDDRVNFMLRDSHTALFLTTRSLSELGQEFGLNRFEGENIFIEELSDSPALLPDTGVNTCSTDLAYVMYTSGTTGRPKAVLVEHGNVVHYVHWRMKAYGITQRDVTLQLLSFAFDGFAANFYSSLLSGGSLVIVEESRKMDYLYINNRIREEQVTNMSLVPGMYEALVDIAEPGDLESLRFVVLGGEKASPNLIKRAREKNPGHRHIIEYGPTETTVCAVANVEVSAAETGIIGKPLPHTGAYVLDQFHQPQPLKVPGELCISGAGLARGYLNNPELSAEKFTPLLRNGQETQQGNNRTLRGGRGGKLYRTGDLAQWLPDGNIEFIKRIDQQVKIRGFRVELEEITSLLLRNPEVEQCLVIPRESGSELELAAFYKRKSGSPVTTADLRELLSRTLPDYMRPSQLIEVTEFPLTPNGKIDRKALAQSETIDKKEECFRPGNEIEKRILEVFKQVIGVREIGVDSGFFDAGGTSMKAIFAQAQLSKEFNVSVDHFYRYRNIREMAKNVTWKKENLEKKIRELKTRLEVNPQVVEEYRAREKEVEEAYREYLRQIGQEELPEVEAGNHYRQIFLTGATGYLGSHLVYELLKTTEARLHLLVRGETPREAEARLQSKLDFYFGEDFFSGHRERLHVVAGDLRGEHLGIDDPEYEELCAKTDALIHAAADTREFGMYEDFHKANVVGVENLLDMVKQGNPKDLHHISTLEVAPGHMDGKRTCLFSEYCCDVGQVHTDRVRSNLEAEKKVIAARETGANGTDISIYRVGNLTFHSGTGKFREDIENDNFFTQIHAFILLGRVPELKAKPFELSFIDQTAAAITKLITRKHLTNRTYHLRSSHELTWQDLVPLLHASGKSPGLLKLSQFLDHLLDCLAGERHIPTIARLLRRFGLFKKNADTAEHPTLVKVPSDRSERILQRLGFQWEALTESHLREMVGYCRQKGYIE
jgi:amino acid adenylation domain-containing protein/thioester reductase-like protein